MTDLLVHLELVKLAHALRVDVTEVQFLDTLTAQELAALRASVQNALFAPHEPRFERLAKTARLLPPVLAAKAAPVALSPVIVAGVSAVIDPPLAVKMASHLDRDYLERVVPHLDPTRIDRLLGGLPDELIVDMGRRLLRNRDYLTLGRFVAHLPVTTSLEVVADAGPLDLLQIALHTDDHGVLDDVVAALPDDRVSAIVSAADERDAVEDALALLASLTPAAAGRILGLVAALDEGVRESLVRQVARSQAWERLAPGLERVDPDSLRTLLDVPALREPAVWASLSAAADRSPAVARWYAELSS